jgi:hypothetical protein
MKKIIAIVAAFAIVGFNGFMLMEGAVTRAADETVTSSGSAIDLDWNVILTVGEELSLTCDTADADLGTINGLIGGRSTVSTTCNVKTSDAAGWELTIEADTDPAMQSATDFIADYTEGTPGTPEAWSVAASAAEFGFEAVGTKVISGKGANLYQGFTHTTAILVAEEATTTPYTGIDTTFGFSAEIGNQAAQASGDYHATVQATAVAK